MDVTKWTAALLCLTSLATGGCCCNQPCSWTKWGGGTTYAPPPAQPVYQQPVAGAPYSAPVYSAPGTTAPVMTSQPAGVPVTGMPPS